MRYDLLIVLLIALAAASYTLVSSSVEAARLHRLAPMCAQEGIRKTGYEWQLVDYNLGGPAKCRDPRTTLMYLPDDVLNAR